MSNKPVTHPVQIRSGHGREYRVPAVVALKAYEVYCELFGAQPAMVDLPGRNCRGGFGGGDLIAFLYAHSFPKAEWQHRFDEAINGMEI